jgi:hypothetical protein
MLYCLFCPLWVFYLIRTGRVYGSVDGFFYFGFFLKEFFSFIFTFTLSFFRLHLSFYFVLAFTLSSLILSLLFFDLMFTFTFTFTFRVYCFLLKGLFSMGGVQTVPQKYNVNGPSYSLADAEVYSTSGFTRHSVNFISQRSGSSIDDCFPIEAVSPNVICRLLWSQNRGYPNEGERERETTRAHSHRPPILPHHHHHRSHRNLLLQPPCHEPRQPLPALLQKIWRAIVRWRMDTCPGEQRQWRRSGERACHHRGRRRQPAERSAQQPAAGALQLRHHRADGSPGHAHHGGRGAVSPSCAPRRRGRRVQRRGRVSVVCASARREQGDEGCGGRARDSGFAGSRGAELFGV